jgi:RNA polymerase subunit RPABC4/transcription elongation factor Spt4
MTIECKCKECKFRREMQRKIARLDCDSLNATWSGYPALIDPAKSK